MKGKFNVKNQRWKFYHQKAFTITETHTLQSCDAQRIIWNLTVGANNDRLYGRVRSHKITHCHVRRTYCIRAITYTMEKTSLLEIIIFGYIQFDLVQHFSKISNAHNKHSLIGPSVCILAISWHHIAFMQKLDRCSIGWHWNCLLDRRDRATACIYVLV